MTTRVELLGTGHALPDQRVENEYIENLFGVDAGWIASRMRITSRYWARDRATGQPRPGCRNSELAAAAARRALDAADIPAEQVDLLVTATCTPDYALPPLAPLVQEHLGIENCTPIDIRAACVGGIAAMSVAVNAIRVGEARTAVMVASDCFSMLLNLDPTAPYTDRTDMVNAALFGDGAGALVLGAGASDGGRSRPTISTLRMGSVGKGRAPGVMIGARGSAQALTAETLAEGAHRLRQDYRGVLASGDELYWRAAEAIAEAEGVPFSAFARAIPHQANGALPELFAQLVPEHVDRIYFNVDRVGNCAAASIFIALDESIREKAPMPGERVMIITAEASKWLYGGACIRW